MRRLSLTELLKNSIAFTAVSGSVIDAGLLLVDRSGTLDVPPEWYFNAPLGVWVLVGIPATISLAERLVRQTRDRSGRITAHLEGAPSPFVRAIPFGANGRRGSLLAHSVRSIFGETVPEQGREVHQPAVWRVPVDDNAVTIRESELRAFLDVAHRRRKHQFSRNYWTRTRRPPLWRGKYEALMRLLVESGLVEGRHTQGGASGRLTTFPREAIMYLKHESCYAIPGN